MVKGITRQVMVVKTPDTGLFEQAIFLLREDSLEKKGITERQILEEAKRLSESGMEGPKGPCGVHRLPPLAWSGIGAGFTALLWLITAVF